MNTSPLEVNGTLSVRSVNGRNGAFHIGTLKTPVGVFAVKDPEVDQLDEGSYEGRFGIDWIHMGSYVTGRGAAVSEIRAKLGFMSLDQAGDISDMDDASLERDPADEQADLLSVPSESVEPPMADDAPSLAEASVSPESVDQPVVPDSDPGQENPDQSLFGALWPIGDSVQLDPSVDRILFRKQRDRLKLLGYVFNPAEQRWHLRK